MTDPTIMTPTIDGAAVVAGPRSLRDGRDASSEAPSVIPATGAGEDLHIGQPVHVVVRPEIKPWSADWQYADPLFVAGMRMVKGKLDIELSEQWPPEPGTTDGFERDDLSPASVGAGERAAVEVRKIETVTGDFLTEPGEPFWRIEIDGFCADFDYEAAADNFAAAINRHYTPTAAPERAEIVADQREPTVTETATVAGEQIAESANCSAVGEDVVVCQADRNAAVYICRQTGWAGVATRLERGWQPEPGTSEANLLDELARHRAAAERRGEERMREHLPIFERVTRLADTLASNAPADAEVRGHIERAYAAIRSLDTGGGG